MKIKQVILFCLAALLLVRCSNKVSEKTEAVEPVLDSTLFNIPFVSYPPNDLVENASQRQLVEFAWGEFFALNWKSSYGKNGKRDYPDITWSYSDQSKSAPDTLVWETYAHRVELRPFNGKMKPFDSVPSYSFGVDPKAKPKSNASFALFDVLDENNEIGSCDLFAHVTTEQKQFQVLYQAKVNREEYDYIKGKYGDTTKLKIARNENLSNLSRYGSYSKDTTYCLDENYPGISLPCGCNDIAKGRLRQGAIEVKTAWRQLLPDEDANKFLTRKVVVFTKDAKNNFFYENETYALIGLHIIHKTQNYPQFIFATWEHVGVTKDTMGYVLLNNGKETGAPVPNYQRYKKIAPIVDGSTSYVHQKLRAMNPGSVWLNYRLVGVQGHPTSDSTSFNFFLANYVVESDPILADFHGSSIGTPHDQLPNTYTKGKLVSMGGCQGCHGVAQKKFGTDFSFLLDNVGKPVYTPDVRNGSNYEKLKRYVGAIKE